MDNPSQHPSDSLKRPHPGGRGKDYPSSLSAGQQGDPSTSGGMNPHIKPFTLPTHPSAAPPPVLSSEELAALDGITDGERISMMGNILGRIQQLNSVTGAPTNAAPFGELTGNTDSDILLRLAGEDTAQSNSTSPLEDTSAGPRVSDQVSDRPSYWRAWYSTPPPLSDVAWALLQPKQTTPSVAAVISSLSSPVAPETSTPDPESVANPPADQPSQQTNSRSTSATFKVVPTPDPHQSGEQGTSSGNEEETQAEGQQQSMPLPAVEATFFRVVEVMHARPNRSSGKRRITQAYVLNSEKLAEYLPLPPDEMSWEARLTRQEIEGEAPKPLTIRLALGWEFIILSILNFRSFFLEMLIIPDLNFPASLPKDDVIDVGLVLLISGWISNLVAMRILGGKLPTAANVAHFIEICLGSLEVTILLSIACQADLSNRTVEEIEFLTWKKIFTPSALLHYVTRVAVPVKQRVLSWYFEFVFHVLSGTIRAMTNTRLSPDTAAHWYRKYLLASTALDGQLSGCRVHLFLKDPSLHTHINDVDGHDMYTQHEGADVCRRTIAKCHDEIRAGKVPSRTSFMFRSGIETDAVSNAIDYLVETTPLAISLTHQKGRNPYVDYTKVELHLLGLLPVITALVTVAYSSLAHYGSETSPDKIVGNRELNETYEKQSRCVNVWLREALSQGTSPRNLEDLKFMNSFISRRLIQAIQSCQGTRRVWHSGRSDSVFYDPLICWTTTPYGPQQDFLSYYEAVGKMSDELFREMYGDGKPPVFRRSAVTDLYDEVLKAHKEKMTAEGLKPDAEQVGGEAILSMSHLTKETTGDAWPLISVCINRAQRTAAADTVELTNLLRGVAVPPPRTRRRFV